MRGRLWSRAMGQEETIPAGFAEEIGIEWIDLDPDNARARITVEPRHLQPFGIVHGGVYATLAESICSAATYNAVTRGRHGGDGPVERHDLPAPDRRGHTSRRRHELAIAAARPGSGTSR